MCVFQGKIGLPAKKSALFAVATLLPCRRALGANTNIFIFLETLVVVYKKY